MEAWSSSHVLFSSPISPLCLRWTWQLCQTKERGWGLRSKSWRKLWSLWASLLLLSQVTLTSRNKFSWETVWFTPPSASDHCSCSEIYKSISESQVESTSSDARPGSSQVKPISRQGGTILLPSPPAQGSSQHQSSSSSLGLQLSQGYTQMFGGRVNGETLAGQTGNLCSPVSVLQQTPRFKPFMAGGWRTTVCWQWKMPPVRPSTISTNPLNPALMLKPRLRTPGALRCFFLNFCCSKCGTINEILTKPQGIIRIRSVSEGVSHYWEVALVIWFIQKTSNI